MLYFFVVVDVKYPILSAVAANIYFFSVIDVIIFHFISNIDAK